MEIDEFIIFNHRRILERGFQSHALHVGLIVEFLACVEECVFTLREIMLILLCLCFACSGSPSCVSYEAWRVGVFTNDG